jgi:transposase
MIRETPISLRQLAKRLGVTPKTVYLWSSPQRGAKPRLETARVGGKRMTSLEALQRFTQQDDETPAVQVPHSSSSEYEREKQLLRAERGF